MKTITLESLGLGIQVQDNINYTYCGEVENCHDFSIQLAKKYGIKKGLWKLN